MLGERAQIGAESLEASALISSCQYYPSVAEACMEYEVKGMPLEALCSCAYRNVKINEDILPSFYPLLLGRPSIQGSKIVLLPEGTSLGELDEARKWGTILFLGLSACKGCTILMEWPERSMHPLLQFLLGVTIGSLTSHGFNFHIATNSLPMILGTYASCSQSITRIELLRTIFNIYNKLGVKLNDEQSRILENAKVVGNCNLMVSWCDAQVTVKEVVAKLSKDFESVNEIYEWLPALYEELKR